MISHVTFKSLPCQNYCHMVPWSSVPSLFRAHVHALQDADKINAAEDAAEEHDVKQFAPRDSHGLTHSQRNAVDRVHAGIKALQVEPINTVAELARACVYYKA